MKKFDDAVERLLFGFARRASGRTVVSGQLDGLAPVPAAVPGQVAIKVINHYGDEVMKVFGV